VSLINSSPALNPFALGYLLYKKDRVLVLHTDAKRPKNWYPYRWSWLKEINDLGFCMQLKILALCNDRNPEAWDYESNALLLNLEFVKSMKALVLVPFCWAEVDEWKGAVAEPTGRRASCKAEISRGWRYSRHVGAS